MANFISHTILAEKSNILNLNINYLKLFSIGQDLTFSNKKCFNLTHEYNTLSFFSNLIRLIKKYNCENNEVVLCFLYGHITHLCFDKTIHPFINSMEDNYLFNHNIIECRLDEYLIEIYESDDIKKALNLEIDNYNILAKIINELYYEVYGERNIYKYYKKTIELTKKANFFLSKIYKRNIIKKSNISQITEEEMNNIFEDSVNESIDKIEKINIILYNDYEETAIKEIIGNVSYNSGNECKILSKKL